MPGHTPYYSLPPVGVGSRAIAIPAPSGVGVPGAAVVGRAGSLAFIEYLELPLRAVVIHVSDLERDRLIVLVQQLKQYRVAAGRKLFPLPPHRLPARQNPRVLAVERVLDLVIIDPDVGVGHV